MQPIEGFTPSMLWTFLIVLIGLATIALLGLNLVSKIKELRKPIVQSEKTTDEKLANDNRRISELEKITDRQEKELKLILRSQMAMLHHMVDGNNTDNLKKTQSQIEDFLTYGTIE